MPSVAPGCHLGGSVTGEGRDERQSWLNAEAAGCRIMTLSGANFRRSMFPGIVRVFRAASAQRRPDRGRVLLCSGRGRMVMSDGEKLSHIKMAAHEPPLNYGIVVDLSFAQKHNRKRLGSGANKGECATGVQVVFIEAGRPLGLTRTWKQGRKVRGNRIKRGTAIASFRNGKFRNDHAAIFIEERKMGLWVWDQYNNPQKSWGKRMLYFDRSKHDYSNNGDLFYVIKK